MMNIYQSYTHIDTGRKSREKSLGKNEKFMMIQNREDNKH